MKFNKIYGYIKILLFFLMAFILFYSVYYNKLTVEIMVSFMISLTILLFIFYILYKYKFDKWFINLKKLNLNTFFVVYSFILGISLSVLIPTYMIPDEVTHINMIYNERNIEQEYFAISNGYHGSEMILVDDNSKIDIRNYFDFSKRIESKKIFSMPKLAIIRHLPQAIGMIVGEILRLPVFFYLFFIEFCALIFYIFICNKALKKMPIKKECLMCIMLLPVCLQQCASVSYDVVLNAISFLFIATIFNLKFEKKNIDMKDILFLLLYLFIICICKPPYLVMGLLVFLLPIDKINVNIFKFRISGEKIKNKFLIHKVRYSFLLFVLFLIFSFICYKLLMSINSGRVLIASLINFKSTIILIVKTLRNFLLFLIDTVVGNLCLFNVQTPKICNFIVIFSTIFISFLSFKKVERKEIVDFKKLRNLDIIIIFITFISISFLIILSMFEWTLYVMEVPNYDNMSINEIGSYIKNLSYIGGVQGRYFVPILPLVLIPLGNKKIYEKALKFNPITFQLVYYVFLFCYMILLMLFRFWI